MPQVVYGYFAVNSDGDDLIVWQDEQPGDRVHPVHLPAPARRALPLHRGLLPADRVGRARLRRVPHRHDGRARCRSATAELFAENKYQDYLLLHGLGVEMAEALAEMWHRRIREEMGFADEDGPTLTGLFRQQYRGGRYSWGYPACPDLEDNAKVADLLSAPTRSASTVSEETVVAVPPGADDLRDHLPPPPGEVLRRPGLTPELRRGVVLASGGEGFVEDPTGLRHTLAAHRAR